MVKVRSFGRAMIGRVGPGLLAQPTSNTARARPRAKFCPPIFMAFPGSVLRELVRPATLFRAFASSIESRPWFAGLMLEILEFFPRAIGSAVYSWKSGKSERKEQE